MTPDLQRMPERVVWAKSVDRRNRWLAGNIRTPGADSRLRVTDQAERRVRPFERRAARIARPARVRIRARKPCVLARLRLFGWKVRFMPGSVRTWDRSVKWAKTTHRLTHPTCQAPQA